MRVDCVITAMGCGGAERRLAWLINQLVDRGHNVGLRVLHGTSSHFEIDARVDIRFFTQDHPRVQTSPVRFWKRCRWLREQICAARTDVILSFIDVANVTTLLAASRLQVPVAIAERAYPPLNRIPWYYRALRQRLYRFSDAVVVQTEEAASWTQSVGCGHKVKVIPNPVPPPIGDSSVGPPISLPQGPKLVTMGRLAPEKGFDLLVAAFAEIADTHREWTLLILGEGAERNRIFRDVTSRGLQDRVLLLGQVSRPETVMRECELFVLSSHHEGFPNALCEAMACGLPAVSFDCPVGPRNIIRDGIDGVLVPAGDVAALATAVSRLLADRDLRLALATRAVEVVSRFDAETIADEWENLLRRLAAGKGEGLQ